MQNFMLCSFHYVSKGQENEMSSVYTILGRERKNAQKIFVRRHEWKGQLESFILWCCGLDSTGLGLVPVLKCHECGKEWSGSMKHVKFSDWLCKYCLIRKMFAPRIIKKLMKEGVSHLHWNPTECWTHTKDAIYPFDRFTVWSRAFALRQTSYAAKIGPRILHYLETYFNIPFPLPKQDMVALPDFGFSAMENWGLITFR
jgi:hypothetical protein